MLYRILLLSVKHQHESAIGIGFNSSLCFSFPQNSERQGLEWWIHHKWLKTEWILICDEAATEISTEQVIHVVLTYWVQSRQQNGYTFIMAHLENAAARPGASALALCPLEAALHATATKILFQSESYPMAPMTRPSVTPLLSESQILILTVLQASLWLVARAYVSCLPLPCPSTTLVLSAASVQFSSVQSLSRVLLFVTPWIAARQASLSITNSQSSLRLTSIIRPFFGGLFSKPPYHRAFPWPLPASFIPITFFLQNSPHKWHRIFPNFILCFPPLLCVYYSTIFCLQPFPYSNNYALSIKKIHFDKHFTSDSPTSYSR